MPDRVAGVAEGQGTLSGPQSSLIRRFIEEGDPMEEVAKTGGMQSQSFRWNTPIGRLVVRPCALEWLLPWPRCKW